MTGTRENWRQLLPLIQAFCKGEAIQRLDYDGRWKDDSELYSLLHGRPWRVKPKKNQPPQIGIWTRRYRDRCIGSGAEGFEEGVVSFDKMADDDVPVWPQHNYVDGPKFVPK